MRNYLVIWEVDILAVSSEEAAREAYRIQRDPDSIATVFRVAEKTTPNRVKVIDVGKEE